MLTFVDVAGAGGGAGHDRPGDQRRRLRGRHPHRDGHDAATGGADRPGGRVLPRHVGGGTGTAMTAVDGSFDTATEDVTAAVPIPSGQHILYVRGQDSAGQLGPVQLGARQRRRRRRARPRSPPYARPRRAPTAARGVAVTATGDDTALGRLEHRGGRVLRSTRGADGRHGHDRQRRGTDRQPRRHHPGGDRQRPAPRAPHVVSIAARTRRATGVTPSPSTLVVDKTGPGTSGVTATPEPEQRRRSRSTRARRGPRDGDHADRPGRHGVNSRSSGGEAFIDTVGATGTGIPLHAERRRVQHADRGRLRRHPAGDRPAAHQREPHHLRARARTRPATGVPAAPRRWSSTRPGRRSAAVSADAEPDPRRRHRHAHRDRRPDPLIAGIAAPSGSSAPTRASGNGDPDDRSGGTGARATADRHRGTST